MEKEEFEKLPINHQLDYVKILLDSLGMSIRSRMEILPSASALAAMLLIVATFGDKIISFNAIVKVLLSLLLLIIPMALFFYNSDLKMAQKRNIDYLDKLLGNNLNKDISEEKTKLSKFIGFFPDIVIYLLALIIVVFIWLIWIK